MSLHVDRLDTGDWIIWGADSEEKALTALLGDVDFAEQVSDRRLTEFPDHDVDVVLIADVHLMRKNPCGPSSCGEHGWHVGYTRNSGHGARMATLVSDFRLVPIEYESDI